MQLLCAALRVYSHGFLASQSDMALLHAVTEMVLPRLHLVFNDLLGWRISLSCGQGDLQIVRDVIRAILSVFLQLFGLIIAGQSLWSDMMAC